MLSSYLSSMFSRTHTSSTFLAAKIINAVIAGRTWLFSFSTIANYKTIPYINISLLTFPLSLGCSPELPDRTVNSNSDESTTPSNYGIPWLENYLFSSISGSMFRTCVSNASRRIWRAVTLSKSAVSGSVRSLSYLSFFWSQPLVHSSWLPK